MARAAGTPPREGGVIAEIQREKVFYEDVLVGRTQLSNKMRDGKCPLGRAAWRRW